MNEETSFRIAFFSNSSNESYPNNEPDNFRVKLAHPVTFTGRWECALTDLHMINSKYNIRPEHNEIVVYKMPTKKVPENEFHLKQQYHTPKGRFALKPGYYSSLDIQDIINNINRLIEKFTATRTINKILQKKRGIQLTYINKRVLLNLRFGYAIHLGKDIIQFLKLNPYKSLANKLSHFPIYGNTIGDFVDEQRLFDNTILICTDLIKNQYFESKTLPLLKAVICGSKENLKQHDFQSPTFCELSKNHFESINIRILDQSTTQVYLSDHPMFFQLEFRKIL